MDKIKVIIEDRQKKEVSIPTGMRLLVRRCCNAVIKMEEMEGNFAEEGSVEVSVSFVGKKEITELNQKYRGKDTPTDVLSFPLAEDKNFPINPETGARMLGDIVICLAVAVRQAEDLGHSLQREVGFLTTHGMLHLLDYDHEKGGMQELKMREKEEHIMSLMGYPRTASYNLEDIY